MRIAFYGDSLTRGVPGVSFLRALKKMLPQDELMNLGKGGDTVVSLYRRVARRADRSVSDLAVLWVGVNDVLATVSRGHSALKWLMGQPRAKDPIEFREYYDRTLTCLCSSADNILTVSPLLIGEDRSNPWNRRLEELGETIRSVSESLDGVHHVDLHSELPSEWPASEASNYIPRSVTRIALESLFLRSPERVDKTASRRGLHLTLDGIHLNSTGAERVAMVIRRAIDELSASKGEVLRSSDRD
jgi:lysophospholipase L1-like esterase